MPHAMPQVAIRMHVALRPATMKRVVPGLFRARRTAGERYFEHDGGHCVRENVARAGRGRGHAKDAGGERMRSPISRCTPLRPNGNVDHLECAIWHVASGRCWFSLPNVRAQTPPAFVPGRAFRKKQRKLLKAASEAVSTSTAVNASGLRVRGLRRDQASSEEE